MIGGMDEHAENEYEEAKKRHDFLSSQLGDLESAMEKTVPGGKESAPQRVATFSPRWS